jgi:hypothetical protein
MVQALRELELVGAARTVEREPRLVAVAAHQRERRVEREQRVRAEAAQERRHRKVAQLPQHIADGTADRTAELQARELRHHHAPAGQQHFHVHLRHVFEQLQEHAAGVGVFGQARVRARLEHHRGPRERRHVYVFVPPRAERLAALAHAGALAAVEHFDGVEGVPRDIEIDAPVAGPGHDLLEVRARQPAEVRPPHEPPERFHELRERRRAGLIGKGGERLRVRVRVEGRVGVLQPSQFGLVEGVRVRDDRTGEVAERGAVAGAEVRLVRRGRRGAQVPDQVGDAHRDVVFGHRVGVPSSCSSRVPSYRHAA